MNVLFFTHGDRMNILITGGAGFVCSHLADRLYEKKHNLFLLDNLLTGNKSNVDHLLENENVKFIEHDVQNHIEISDDIDFIFHFASAASPIAYQENPVNTLKAGSIGTINTLGLAKVKKADYLLASTSEIYGDPEVSPQSEEYWAMSIQMEKEVCMMKQSGLLKQLLQHMLELIVLTQKL